MEGVDVGVGGDDDEVPLHLHACRVVSRFVCRQQQRQQGAV